MTPAGDFVVAMASVDLGQGLRAVLAQIAAETLGVPYESIVAETADTDTAAPAAPAPLRAAPPIVPAIRW